MNGLRSAVAEIDAILDGLSKGMAGRAATLICPPFPLVAECARRTEGRDLRIGAQGLPEVMTQDDDRLAAGRLPRRD